MPKQRQKERIVGQFFNWLLGTRNGVYYADGRSNRPNAGRHSLGTRSYPAALEALKQLDRVQAVQLGVAHTSVLEESTGQLVLAEGRRRYEAHVRRPRVVGGARPASAKRYRAVLDKFVAFAQREGIAAWDQVTGSTLEAYATHLGDLGYAYATQYLELTTLKQRIKWLVEAGHLPHSCLIHLRLSKPEGTSTYCWRPQEVQAMVRHCQAQQELAWLARVLVALVCTGLRISELASLRWSDVDWTANQIRLTDESRKARRHGNRPARQTKSGRSRSFPIHADLRAALEELTPAMDGLIFHGPHRGKLKPDTVRRALVRDVLAPLGPGFPTGPGETGFADGRLHSFRHFFCSRCAQSGVPEQVVKEWLGHRDSEMVRHYFHLHNEESQRQMRRLSFLGDVAGGGASPEV